MLAPSPVQRSSCLTSSNLSTRSRHGPCRRPEALRIVCARGHRRRARQPGTFEVRIVTPPPTSLGIHRFPPDTHNGDQIEVDGKDYVVSSLVVRYQLVGGKYERDHNQLEVQQTSRYFLNQHLDHLLSSKS